MNLKRINTTTVVKCSDCKGETRLYEDIWEDTDHPGAYYHNGCRPKEPVVKTVTLKDNLGVTSQGKG